MVCGDLTFTSFNIDSGTVVIRPGARLLIGGGAGVTLRGNSSIYNYGTLEVISNLALGNNWASAAKPNVLINATTSSVFKMSNQYLVINNPYSFFVNNGSADFHGIITDPGAAGGSVCLGNSSRTSMRVLYNKSKKPYTAPSGIACVQVLQFSQFYDTLTASANIHVCLGPTHTSDASCTASGCKPNAWGAASVFALCNNCAEAQVLGLRSGSFATTASKEVTLSPNPFVQTIDMKWPRPKRALAVVITGIDGAVVYKQLLSSNATQCTVRIPASPAIGEYVVKLVFADEVVVKKMLKVAW